MDLKTMTNGTAIINIKEMQEVILRNNPANAGELLQEVMYLQEAQELFGLEGISLQDGINYFDLDRVIALGKASFDDAEDEAPEKTREELFEEALDFPEGIFYLRDELCCQHFDVAKAQEYLRENYSMNPLERFLAQGCLNLVYEEVGGYTQMEKTLELFPMLYGKTVETQFFSINEIGKGDGGKCLPRSEGNELYNELYHSDSNIRFDLGKAEKFIARYQALNLGDFGKSVSDAVLKVVANEQSDWTQAVILCTCFQMIAPSIILSEFYS